MTRRTRGIALVMFGVAMSACTAIAGLTDEYRLADGGGSAGEGGSADGNVDKDGALPDGFVPGTDGGADALPDQLVATDAGFCQQYGAATDVTYCDDFELATSGPKWGWDDFTTTGATLARETGIGVKGSAALHAVVANAPDGGSSAYLRKEVGAAQFNSFRSQELSFSISVKKKSTLYGATVGALGHGASLQYIGASVYTAVPNDGIDVSDPPGTLVSPYQTAVVGEWHRVIITMTRMTAGVYSSKVEITAIGTTGATNVVDGPRPGFAGGSTPTEILVGAFFTSAPGTVETIIDDVLLKQVN